MSFSIGTGDYGPAESGPSLDKETVRTVAGFAAFFALFISAVSIHVRHEGFEESKNMITARVAQANSDSQNGSLKLFKSEQACISTGVSQATCHAGIVAATLLARRINNLGGSVAAGKVFGGGIVKNGMPFEMNPKRPQWAVPEGWKHSVRWRIPQGESIGYFAGILTDLPAPSPNNG